MSKEQFLENLKLPDMGGGLTEEEKALGFGDEDGWGDSGDDGWGDDSAGDSGWGDEPAKDASAGTSDYFFPSDVSVIEIQEDMIFDKRRSRQYWDIQSLTLIIPAETFASTTGLQRRVGSFKYIDLVALFRSMPQEALWFNRQNSAEHKILPMPLL